MPAAHDPRSAAPRTDPAEAGAPIPPGAIRAGGVLAGMAAFVAAAALVQPDWARADETGAFAAPADRDLAETVVPIPETRTPADRVRPTLGRLEGPDGHIEIVATADGPRFRPVRIDATGQAFVDVGQRLREADDLGLDDAVARPATMLMLAPTDRAFGG